jgi:hypothetical protein
MGLRGILFWPVYRLTDWIDNNPVSAVGAIVALAALAVFIASVTLGSDAGRLTLDATSTTLVLETAVERPAYPVTALVGIVIVLFYDG